MAGSETELMGLHERLAAYFSRPIAEKGAASLSAPCEIELRVLGGETHTLTREGKRNGVRPGAAHDPDLTFTLTPAALEQILNDPAEELGTIGINMLRLVFSDDPNVKMNVTLHAGFLRLFSRGYFGVLTAGGKELAAFLASRGFSGIGAFKQLLKRK